MENDNDAAEAADPATAAFSRLEGEIALMRRAVEKLATEKADIDIPDYNDTLTEISQNLSALTTTMADILAKPAMGLTPENMARRMTDAARSEREADRGRIDTLQSLYNGAVQELRTMVARAHVAADQRKRIIWAASGGILAGCLIWSILPGVVARSLPDNWSMPEKIAARVLREPSMWEGGVRLLRVGSPRAWKAISDAAEMRHHNKKVIADCERAAAKVGKPVRCTVKVTPAQ
jgi:hypothetical protein